MVNLRRTIYLTIMSALDFEEAGHKLLKMVGGWIGWVGGVREEAQATEVGGGGSSSCYLAGWLSPQGIACAQSPNLPLALSHRLCCSPPACLLAWLQGIPNGQEMELTTMIIECCSNEKTFIK
jgi:hypothetical protein